MMHTNLALVAMLVAVVPAAAFVPTSPGPLAPMALGPKPSSCRRCLSTSELFMMKDDSRRAFVAGMISVPFFLADRVAAQDAPHAQYAPLVPEGYSGPLPTMELQPSEVVNAMLKGLTTVDQPVKNHGLFTVVAFSTLYMPFAQMPIEQFRGIMDNSGYKVLFNGYETSEVIPQVLFDDMDKQVAFLDTKLYNTAAKLAALGVKPENVATKDGKTWTTMRWELKRVKGVEDPWRFSTVYFYNEA